MKKLLTATFCLLSIGVFAQSNVDKLLQRMTPIPTTEKKLEIPFYEEYKNEKVPFVYWHFSKQKEKQLGLRSPELDKNSTIFRLWITNPSGSKNQPHALIEIVKDSAGWDGRLILMRVNFDQKKLAETITKSEIVELTPAESDWANVMDSLIYYKINELPTDENIPNYYKGNNKYNNNDPTYSFEYSTADSYRFFQYNDIYRAIDKFWQPQNVDKILDLLNRNFNWYETGRKYFKGK